jgi:hypothetical protein
MTEISINELMKARFAAGHGVITLAPSMTDEQILQMVKLGCAWSEGKAFMVIPPSPIACRGISKPTSRLRRKVSVGALGATIGAMIGYGTALMLSVGSGPTGLIFDITGVCALFGAVIFSAVFTGIYSGFVDG